MCLGQDSNYRPLLYYFYFKPTALPYHKNTFYISSISVLNFKKA